MISFQTMNHIVSGLHSHTYDLLSDTLLLFRIRLNVLEYRFFFLCFDLPQFQDH